MRAYKTVYVIVFSSAMVDCLANSLENSELKPGKLEVDTECLAQKISLSKYITKECHCDVSVLFPLSHCYLQRNVFVELT